MDESSRILVKQSKQLVEGLQACRKSQAELGGIGKGEKIYWCGRRGSVHTETVEKEGIARIYQRAVRFLRSCLPGFYSSGKLTAERFSREEAHLSDQLKKIDDFVSCLNNDSYTYVSNRTILFDDLKKLKSTLKETKKSVNNLYEVYSGEGRTELSVSLVRTGAALETDIEKIDQLLERLETFRTPRKLSKSVPGSPPPRQHRLHTFSVQPQRAQLLTLARPQKAFVFNPVKSQFDDLERALNDVDLQLNFCEKRLERRLSPVQLSVVERGIVDSKNKAFRSGNQEQVERASRLMKCVESKRDQELSDEIDRLLR